MDCDVELKKNSHLERPVFVNLFRNPQRSYGTSTCKYVHQEIDF